jgi:hypothetical protein
MGLKILIILREEHRLKEPQNMVLGKIFGSKRRLHEEELMTFTPHQILFE